MANGTRVPGLLGPAALGQNIQFGKKPNLNVGKRPGRDSWNGPLLNLSPSLTSWGFLLTSARLKHQAIGSLDQATLI